MAPQQRGAPFILALGGFIAPLMLWPSVGGDEPPALAGYSTDAARIQVEWETKFRAIPQTDNLREVMRRLSARPHHVGSPYDRENAFWILERFRSYGLEARIDSFMVLFPTPKERAVELVEPTKFVAKLQEPALSVDPTSGQRSEQLPTYNAYSADGDVTAPLVYVNRGVPADYERLERLGISVKGAIVIARYGGSWRGIKPKVAAEHGAVGCLIYSDPIDDGYFEGDVYPQGAYRSRDGVQRGSVADMPTYPGDPLTPGVGATPDAKRLPLAEAATLTRIPVLPISYGDAQPLLAALKGRVAPAEWRGALPITYHIGPGPAKVHLKVKANWDQKPLYDVIATIHGSTAPDQWIIRGNHHDGWVNGAEDPISGQSVLLEEARALAELLKQGWKPRRTIIYAAWDGEEPGLLGSTEWMEAHLDELRAHAAVYINTDANDRGYLSMSGSHTLEKFIHDVARDVQDPETGVSVWKRDQLRRIRNGTAEERKEARERSSLRIDALGSGSDFTPFLQHAGIASLDLGFDGEGDGGIYHSIYDDFYWYTHFSDTSFVYGRALAQVVGTAVLRLADAELLPYDFSGLAETVTKYSTELQKLLKDQQDTLEERSKQLDEGVFAATTDPWELEQAPAREGAPPFLNFAPLQNAADSLSHAAARYDRAITRIREGGETAFAKLPLDKINASLAGAEQRLLDPQGLPGRPWFQHLLYAPGYYTGYAVKTVPAVREALEQKQWQAVEPEVARVSRVLLAEASLVSELAAQLGGGN